ncbi:MAG: universal stress protein [Deltaproteobacteria bacterium]
MAALPSTLPPARPLRLLVGFDGSRSAERAVAQAGALSAAIGGQLTVLCVAEFEGDEQALPARLARVRLLLRESGQRSVVLTRTGKPAQELAATVREVGYDIVVVGGAPRRGEAGYRLPRTTYRVLKSVQPAVLVAKEVRPRLRRILLCTGGLWTTELERVLPFVAERIALPVGAELILYSVVIATPPMFSRDLDEAQRAEGILASGSALGVHLRACRKLALRSGITVSVRVGTGDVVPSVLREIRALDADLVVVGSSPPRGALGSYVLGDLAREILDAADRPVLVLHTLALGPLQNAWRSLRSIFPRGKPPAP